MRWPLAWNDKTLDFLKEHPLRDAVDSSHYPKK
jgi:hypothetical protein